MEVCSNVPWVFKGHRDTDSLKAVKPSDAKVLPRCGFILGAHLMGFSCAIKKMYMLWFEQSFCIVFDTFDGTACANWRSSFSLNIGRTVVLHWLVNLLQSVLKENCDTLVSFKDFPHFWAQSSFNQPVAHLLQVHKATAMSEYSWAIALLGIALVAVVIFVVFRRNGKEEGYEAILAWNLFSRMWLVSEFLCRFIYVNLISFIITTKLISQIYYVIYNDHYMEADLVNEIKIKLL